MKLIILATENDHSAIRFKEEAEKLGIDYNFYYYSDLLKNTNFDWDSYFKKENVNLIARQPYLANKISHNYHSLLRVILDKYKFNNVIDGKLYEKSFIEYEDKFYQTYVFKNEGVNFAPVVDIDNLQNEIFPIIARKRLSSRNKSNFIMFKNNDLQKFLETEDPAMYMFQKFFPLQGDYRVLVYKDKLLGVMRRSCDLKDEHRVRIKGIDKGDVPEEVKKQAIQLAGKIGCDLCGFDVGHTETGKYFFIEWNASPQFTAFEKFLSKNVAKEVIRPFIG